MKKEHFLSLLEAVVPHLNLRARKECDWDQTVIMLKQKKIKRIKDENL